MDILNGSCIWLLSELNYESSCISIFYDKFPDVVKHGKPLRLGDRNVKDLAGANKKIVFRWEIFKNWVGAAVERFLQAQFLSSTLIFAPYWSYPVIPIPGCQISLDLVEFRPPLPKSPMATQFRKSFNLSLASSHFLAWLLSLPWFNVCSMYELFTVTRCLLWETFYVTYETTFSQVVQLPCCALACFHSASKFVRLGRLFKSNLGSPDQTCRQVSAQSRINFCVERIVAKNCC